MTLGRAKEHWQQIVTGGPELDSLSYYQLLGIERDAKDDAISESYYRLVRVAHPDRHARESNPQRKRAVVLFYARISEAYRVLSTPALRKEYDAHLTSGAKRLAQEPPKQTLVETRDPKTAKARELYEQGRQLLGAGDVPRARAQFDLALQFEPDSRAIRQALEDVTPEHMREPAAEPEPEPAAEPAAEPDVDANDAAPAPEPTPAGEPRQRPERRSDSRHPIAQAVRLRCRSWAQFRTLYTRNISRGGMFLRSATPLDPGTRVQLEVALPGDQVVAIDAEVAHVVRTGTRDRAAGMGLCFAELDDERRAQIEGLLGTKTASAAEESGDDDLVLRQLLQELARLRQASAPVALAVPPDADPDVVRKAYLGLAKRSHPDLYRRFGGEEMQDVASEVFFLIRRAYERMRSESAAEGSADEPSPDYRTAITRARKAWIARDYGEARRALRYAVDSAPKDRFVRAAYHVAAGAEAKVAGKTQDAGKHFETALVFDKGCEEALRELSASDSADEPETNMFARILGREESA